MSEEKERVRHGVIVSGIHLSLRYSAVCSCLQNIFTFQFKDRWKVGLLDIVCGAGVLGTWHFVSGAGLTGDWDRLVESAKGEGDWVAERLEDLILWLQSLIEWLMGNPAGLKLNRPLNQTLGHFFLYHIYLWRTYITFLRPVCEWILLGARLALPLGLSLLGAIVTDLSSLLTIHIYCFHIYATRLYQLQVSALISLSRLFRGKKKNPLRNRVDSAEFDAQQLFLGTLLFTVLLFLLPTVLLYYTVFSSLRLAVYLTQQGVDFVTKLPHRFIGSVGPKEEEKKKSHFMQPDLPGSSIVKTIQNVLLGNII